MNTEIYEQENDKFLVSSFYCFTSITDETIENLLKELITLANESKVKGSVLVANEGINGTICGTSKKVKSLLEFLQSSLSQDFLEIHVPV